MSLVTQWRRALQPSVTGYAVVLLTIIAAILRFIFLNSKSLWLDEAKSAIRAAMTFNHLISELFRNEMNMALYYVMLHWWRHLAGSTEISLRLPSVIFATATVPLIYALGAELVDRRVGLMAALLLCVNESCIEFAQQARSYAMIGMLVTLSSLLFLRSIKRSSRSRRAIYLAVGPWAAYAHLFGILILPAQWLSLFMFRVGRETRARLTACIAVVGLLSLPAVILAMTGEHLQLAWIPATSASAVLRPFAMFAGVYWSDPRGQSLVRFATYLATIEIAVAGVLFAIYLATIGVAVAVASERERPMIGFLLLSVVLPIAVTLLVSIFKPLFVARYLLICVPFFVLLAAIGIMRIRPRAVMVVTTVLIIALSLCEDGVFYHNAGLQDWRDAINFVAANAKPGDVLLVFPEWNQSPVDYYVDRLADRPDFRVITGRLHSLDGTGGASNDQADNLRRFLARHDVNSYMRVWIVTDVAHRDEPAMHELEIGHQVTAGPRLVGLVLARID